MTSIGSYLRTALRQFGDSENISTCRYVPRDGGYSALAGRLLWRRRDPGGLMCLYVMVGIVSRTRLPKWVQSHTVVVDVWWSGDHHSGSRLADGSNEVLRFQ